MQRFRLALASKPGDAFFLCRVPSQNLDNLFNKASVEACQKAKKLWTQAVRREDGQDGHQVKYSEDPDAFPEPKWPDDPLLKIIEATFAGRIILTDDNPALLRLRGVRQTGE